MERKTGYLYTASRYAATSNPPSILLEYEDNHAKRRVRTVKLTQLAPSTDPDALTKKVIRSFPRMLDTSTVNYQQVLALVAHVLSQHRHAARAVPNAAATAGRTAPHCVESTATARTCRAGSNCTEETALPWRIGVEPDSRPGSAERPGTADDLARALDDFADVVTATVNPGLGSTTPTQLQSGVYANSRQLCGLGAVSSAERPCVSGSTPSAPEDLNAVPEDELLRVKLRMEHAFVKNQLKPGDPGYVYNKQIDFAPPTESNDWDGEETADASFADNGDQSIDWQEIVQAVTTPATHEHASATSSTSSSRRSSGAEGDAALSKAGPGTESLDESYNADSCDMEPAPEDLELTSNDWP